MKGRVAAAEGKSRDLLQFAESTTQLKNQSASHFLKAPMF